MRVHKHLDLHDYALQGYIAFDGDVVLKCIVVQIKLFTQSGARFAIYLIFH
jgi:hypothetical protein